MPHELKFHPSSASRWLSCTASPTIDVSDLEEPERRYAERGHKLHEVAEHCLRTGGDPPKDLPVDDRLSVEEYVDLVRARPGAKFYEVRAEFAPGCRGRADAVVFDPPWLEVIDFKAGYIFVDPEENEQLSIYALAVARKYRAAFDFSKVRLTIAQPAAENFNSWEVSRRRLEKWGEEVRKTIDLIRRGEGLEYQPSDENCRFCLAKTRCRALQARVDVVAADDFKSADRSSSWKEKLDLVPLLRQWCNGVEARARSMLLSGEEVEGWKVVRGRRGNRRWRSEARTRRFLTKRWGLSVDQIEKPSALLSPSAIEKLVKGDEERPKRAIERLVEQGPEGPPTVVPESDSRKPLTKVELAAKDFATPPDEEEE